MSRKKEMNVCPVHHKKLLRNNTQYGPILVCPEATCDILRWGNSNATPADWKTRQARITAHAAFDALWRFNDYNRQDLYGRLSQYIGLSKAETHIGYFDTQQCRQVVQFVNTIKVNEAEGTG